MPPKPAPKAAPSKKTEAKKKEKIIEDKTFGLKNKKGAKQQKFIQQVSHQVKYGGDKTARQLEIEREKEKLKKDEKLKELAEISAIFKPVQQMGAVGADPKSILCAFFKQGSCAKGNKCKFSHDANVERKGEKRSAYVDMRDDKEVEETSADWDEATLREAVEQKHGKEKNKPSTEIVCKYFLDAVENGKYGWFWECPKGQSCIYRHALPNGFLLKKDRKKLDKKDEISLEDLVERERAALGHNTTKVTLETFLAWKKKKIKEKEEASRKETDKKKKDFNLGRDCGISGREMFMFNPEMGGDEDMEEGDDTFDISNVKRDPGEEDEIQYREIDFSKLIDDYAEVDGSSVSVANPERLNRLKEEIEKEEKLRIAEGATGGTETISLDIDEDLFNGDDEDLDELDEQLEEMTLT